MNLRLLTVVAALAALAVACGGGQSDSAPPGESVLLSPLDFSRAVFGRDVFLLNVLNVHVPYEGEIEGTDAFVPYDKLRENAAALPADRSAPIYVYCRSGRMSAEAAVTLRKMGYERVIDLADGMVAWKAAGLAVLTRN